jgi:hypothetical protein
MLMNCEDRGGISGYYPAICPERLGKRPQASDSIVTNKAGASA